MPYGMFSNNSVKHVLHLSFFSKRIYINFLMSGTRVKFHFFGVQFTIVKWFSLTAYNSFILFTLSYITYVWINQFAILFHFVFNFVKSIWLFKNKWGKSNVLILSHNAHVKVRYQSLIVRHASAILPLFSCLITIRRC